MRGPPSGYSRYPGDKGSRRQSLGGRPGWRKPARIQGHQACMWEGLVHGGKCHGASGEQPDA